MPDAPEQYQPPWKTRTEGIGRLRQDEGTHRESGPNRYSHRRYRRFRARMKAARRRSDEQRVHRIYKELGTRSFTDYIAWLKGDDPLCSHCLEEGLIKAGRNMDHETPIEQGGQVYDPENLDWLCDHHHNIKRATEDKQPKQRND